MAWFSVFLPEAGKFILTELQKEHHQHSIAKAKARCAPESADMGGMLHSEACDVVGWSWYYCCYVASPDYQVPWLLGTHRSQAAVATSSGRHSMGSLSTCLSVWWRRQVAEFHNPAFRFGIVARACQVTQPGETAEQARQRVWTDAQMCWRNDPNLKHAT